MDSNMVRWLKQKKVGQLSLMCIEQAYIWDEYFSLFLVHEKFVSAKTKDIEKAQNWDNPDNK